MRILSPVVLAQALLVMSRHLVAPSLHQEIEHLAFVIDGSPQVQVLATNAHHHLIEMSLRRWLAARSAEPASIVGAKLGDPAAHRLVADVEPASGEQIFDIPVA